jgi:hypothetical protein
LGSPGSSGVDECGQEIAMAEPAILKSIPRSARPSLKHSPSSWRNMICNWSTHRNETVARAIQIPQQFQADLGCPDRKRKIFRFIRTQSCARTSSARALLRGRCAIVTERRCGLRWTLRRQACSSCRTKTPAAYGEVVWSWRRDPGATLARVSR